MGSIIELEIERILEGLERFNERGGEIESEQGGSEGGHYIKASEEICHRLGAMEESISVIIDRLGTRKELEPSVTNEQIRWLMERVSRSDRNMNQIRETFCETFKTDERTYQKTLSTGLSQLDRVKENRLNARIAWMDIYWRYHCADPHMFKQAFMTAFEVDEAVYSEALSKVLQRQFRPPLVQRGRLQGPLPPYPGDMMPRGWKDLENGGRSEVSSQGRN